MQPILFVRSPIAPGAEPHREATERKSQLIRYSDRLSWLNLLRSTWTGREGHKIFNDTRKLLSALSWFFGRHSEQLVVHPFVARLFHVIPESSIWSVNHIHTHTRVWAVKVLQATGQEGLSELHCRVPVPNSPWKYNRKDSYDATNQINANQVQTMRACFKWRLKKSRGISVRAGLLKRRGFFKLFTIASCKMNRK